MLIERTIRRHIEDRMFKGKIIIVYGARQVGKTTLIRDIESRYELSKPLYLNCAYSGRFRPVITLDSGHPLRTIPATHYA